MVRGKRAAELGEGGQVVVGVDGSPAAAAALDAAADTAAAKGAALTVLAAWQLTGGETWALAYGTAGVGGVDLLEDAERSARADAEAAAARARSRHRELAVSTLVQRGTPAEALVQASRDAGLVVVGTRGRGRFSGLLLGSVSHATIHGALCPVVVVPPAPDPAVATQSG